jgi:hypothetical protein
MGEAVGAALSAPAISLIEAMSAFDPKRTLQRGAADRGEYREVAGTFAEAVIRSVELIVHPGAKDAVGEMAMRGDLPPSQKPWVTPGWSAGDRTGAGGVERAKVHVKVLYSIGPTGN